MNRRLMLLAGLVLAAPAVGRAQEKAQRKKGGGLSFIQFDTLNATVNRADGRRGVMTVETGVDVPDAGLRALAEASTPRLRAAYAEVLETYAAGLPPGAVPNADYLSREMQRQTDMVLGRPGARLLLGTILVN
jgi:hypothetical protein